MRVAYLSAAVSAGSRELLRNRITLLLLLLVPGLFYLLTALTTTRELAPFQLGAVQGTPIVSVSQRHEALVFIGLAAVGLISAFFGMNLMQKQRAAVRRLLLCGYASAEVALAALALLLGVTAAVSVFAEGLLCTFFVPEHLGGTLLGFILIGYVYGSYGMLVGSLVRRELEGILCVLLLVNIDAGWLQNPLFYAQAQHQAIIRALPAFFPAQGAVIAAFTDHPLWRPLLAGTAYGSGLLLVALGVWHRRLRICHIGPTEDDA